MSFCVIEEVLADFAVRTKVKLVHKSIMNALCTLNQSFYGRSLFDETVVDVLVLWAHFYLLNAIHHILKVDQFTLETTTLVYASRSSPFVSYVFIRLQLHLNLPTGSPMQIERLADRTLHSFQRHSVPYRPIKIIQ